MRGHLRMMDEYLRAELQKLYEEMCSVFTKDELEQVITTRLVPILHYPVDTSGTIQEFASRLIATVETSLLVSVLHDARPDNKTLFSLSGTFRHISASIEHQMAAMPLHLL